MRRTQKARPSTVDLPRSNFLAPVAPGQTNTQRARYPTIPLIRNEEIVPEPQLPLEYCAGEELLLTASPMMCVKLNLQGD